VLFVGAVLLIIFTFFFGTANLSAQVWMTAMLTFVTFLSLLIVMALDHPFAGDIQVSPAALKRVLAEFGQGSSSQSGVR
jgi:uncharacterized YccA/Bax inhibitor family protein